MLKTSDFDYELPQELIAQVPLENRSSSRLLVLNKQTGAIEHRVFTDILEYLNKGDTLVINNTRVIPARLRGQRLGVRGQRIAVEVLLLKRKEGDVWECIGKKLKLNSEIIFGDGLLKAKVIKILDDGNRLVEFDYKGIWEEILDKLGEMPLPPYIKEKLLDKERYQTVYSKEEGSAAAPTAGLHWTKELLLKVRDKGVNIAEITLHVGLGTFRPVREEDATKHDMHSEWYEIDERNAKIINSTRGKVIANGTTVVRVLETVAQRTMNNEQRTTIEEFAEANSEILGIKPKVSAQSGETDIFIYPPYEFKMVDALITNFHLPKSTLMMLVSSLAGRENILNAYEEAVREKYRFFSFGDAMLIN